jgi:hypothetical protein
MHYVSIHLKYIGWIFTFERDCTLIIKVISTHKRIVKDISKLNCVTRFVLKRAGSSDPKKNPFFEKLFNSLYTLRKKGYPAFPKKTGVLERAHNMQPLGVLQRFFRPGKPLKVLANLKHF